MDTIKDEWYMVSSPWNKLSWQGWWTCKEIIPTEYTEHTMWHRMLCSDRSLAPRCWWQVWLARKQIFTFQEDLRSQIISTKPKPMFPFPLWQWPLLLFMGYTSLYNGQGELLNWKGNMKTVMIERKSYMKILKFINLGDFVYFITLIL